MPKGWKYGNSSNTVNVYVYGLHTYLSLYNIYIIYIGRIAVLTTFWHRDITSNHIHSNMSKYLSIYLLDKNE